VEDNPMNLGKSPARFDERPDTGFHSTSLVLMKKAEFEEIVSFKSQRDIRLLIKDTQV
jgi:hypothetical protein